MTSVFATFNAILFEFSQNESSFKSLLGLLLISEIVFWILRRHVSSAKWKGCENFLASWRSLGIQNRPLRHSILKTWYFRVKSIYCYKLLSVREVGRKPTIGYISYSIMWIFLKQYVIIYSIKCFLQVNKNSANKQFIIYCLFKIFIRLITECAIEKYFEIKTVFKIPLNFYA